MNMCMAGNKRKIIACRAAILTKGAFINAKGKIWIFPWRFACGLAEYHSEEMRPLQLDIMSG